MTVNFQAFEDLPRLKDTREFIRRGDFESAKRIAETELSDAITLHGEMAAEAAPWRTVLAWIYLNLGDRPAYRAALEAEQTLLKQLPKDAKGYEDYGNGALNLAEIHINNGDFAIAEEYLRIAEEAYGHVPKIAVWLPAILLGLTGRVSFYRGDLSLAEKQELDALQLVQGKGAPSLEREFLSTLQLVFEASGDREAAARTQQLLETKLAPPPYFRSFILGTG